MDYWHSLAGRLFKIVFSAYMVLAVIVTLVQLSIEYSATQRIIINDIDSLGKSFSGGVSGAMWEMDRPLLNIMARGMAQSATITGVRISGPDGEIIASVGETPQLTFAPIGILLAPFQYNITLLTKDTSNGVRSLGEMVIYSHRRVAFERVKYSLIVILINSIVKTCGLWLIFYVVITRVLSRPLSQMTEMVSQIKFASESNEMVSLKYPYRDELGVLAESVNKMQERLRKAHLELESVNTSLEETVAERTQRLSEMLKFNETILLDSPLPMGVYLFDGSCVLANSAYAMLFRTTTDRLMSLDFNEIDNLYMNGFRAHCLEALADGDSKNVDIKSFTASSRRRYLECRIIPTFTNGEAHLLVQLIDITERKQVEKDLRREAFHDSLTGLPNRRLLHKRLLHAMHTSSSQNTYFGVVFIDVNKFKQLNDTHGHEVGDKMLVEVASRLKNCVRSTDTIARLGGDEFVILLEGLGSELIEATNLGGLIAEKIQYALSSEYFLGDIRYLSSASIGVRVFMGEKDDPEQIIKIADEAMYEMKKASARTK